MVVRMRFTTRLRCEVCRTPRPNATCNFSRDRWSGSLTEKAVELYEQHLADNFSERDIRHCLHDKDPACWCELDQPCHADVLLRIVNSRPK